MAQDGDVITYSFSGSKVTEDITDIGEIVIQSMEGPDGQDNSGTGGSGGLIEGATADVSNFNTLSIAVGAESTDQNRRPFGGAFGDYAFSATIIETSSGSTELYAGETVQTDSVSIAADTETNITFSGTPCRQIVAFKDDNGNTFDKRRQNKQTNGDLDERVTYSLLDAKTSEWYIDTVNNSTDIAEIDYIVNDAFVAAADAGGTGYNVSNLFGLPPIDGIRGARAGGTVSDPSKTEGLGFGGAGEDGSAQDGGEDGGQELGIASGGTLTTGGSSAGDGEITLSFVAPPSVSNVEFAGLGKRKGQIFSNVTLNKTDGVNAMKVFRATGNSNSFPQDFTEIDEISGSSISEFKDDNPPVGNVEYAFAPKLSDGSLGGESVVSTFTPDEDGAFISSE